MNKNLKAAMVSISVVFVFLGFFFAMYTGISRSTAFPKISDEEKPIQGLYNVVVDQKGWIYYTLYEQYSVQVYSDEGFFQYRIIFPNNTNVSSNRPDGYFRWGFDESGKMHMIDNYGRYVVLEGDEILAFENVGEERGGQLFAKYPSLQKTSYEDQVGNYYRIDGKTIMKYDEQGLLVAEISPSSPWQMPRYVFGVMATIGMCGIWIFGIGLNIFSQKRPK